MVGEKRGREYFLDGADTYGQRGTTGQGGNTVSKRLKAL